MYLTIQNENYGYAVATKGKWVAIGNPSFNEWPPPTASIPTSGSVDVFLYDKKTDTHILQDVLHRHLWPQEEILLAAETGSILHTEDTGSIPSTADKDLIIDWGNYLTASINDYGISLDIHKNYLGVGYTHHSMSFIFSSASYKIDFSGSGAVDIFNLSVYDPDPVSQRASLGTLKLLLPMVSGKIRFSITVPPKYLAVDLQTSPDFVNWFTIQTVNVDYETGGTYVFEFPSSLAQTFFRVTERIETNPYVISIPNPHPWVTESFGRSLSINDDWIAVGSPEYSESRGAVYMFKRSVGEPYSNISWSLHSVITASDAKPGDYFGWSCELNDEDGNIPYSTKVVAYSQSLVVGSNKSSGSKVYYYEISGSQKILSYTTDSFGSYTSITRSIDIAKWQEEYKFSPTYDLIPLTYWPIAYPILSGSYSNLINVPDKFGFDVSIYGNTVAVGAPYDRYYYEYSASAVYKQGAFYIFERCPNAENGWILKLKSNGNEKSLKNHYLGWSLDVHEGKLVVGSPKVTTHTITPCYVQGSLYQAHFCRSEDEYQIHGQFAYLQYNTSSTEWEYNNIYQIKKKYNEPYRNFGYSIDMSDRFIVVGAPMNLSGSWRTVDIYYSGSVPDDFKPVAGQAYIYNLNNYKNQFHVGNAFYRNGKLVIITSGSLFDGLFFNEISDSDYQYDLKFHNKQTLHEKQIICSVDPGEFNVSTNPTSLLFTNSLFDVNKNGRFDFQDLDVLMMYMNWKKTEVKYAGNTDWSSSLLTADDEISWYNYLKTSGSFYGTEALYSQSFYWLNTTEMYRELDFNQDNIIDLNDQNILWKYFSNRLNQKNFDKYVTVNSSRRLYGDIIDHLNSRTNKNLIPYIKSEFFDYERLSKSDPTGSYLTPYVTTIGLYQGGDLVATAKMGSPIKLLPDFPYNFVVKIDF